MPISSGRLILVSVMRILLYALIICSAAVLAAIAVSPQKKYFVGTLEIDINNEQIKYQRAWACEERTLFRPAHNDLFERHYLQRPIPENFVALRSAKGRAVVIHNWIGCEYERYPVDDPRQVWIYDSADEPTYGEVLHATQGGPTVSIPYPQERSFSLRVVRDSKREIELSEYKKIQPLSQATGVDILSHLIKKAGNSIEIVATAWNKTGREGVDTSLTYTTGGWVVPELRAPTKSDQDPNAKKVSKNLSLHPLPWDIPSASKPWPRPSRVLVGDRQVELSDSNPSNIIPPPAGLERAMIWTRTEGNVWAKHCSFRDAPECPKSLP
jgi:hypothetical protein